MNGTSTHPTRERPATPKPDGHEETAERRCDQGGIGDSGMQGTVVELIERVGGDADRGEEGEHRRHQPHAVDMRGQRGSDDHVREVP